MIQCNVTESVILGGQVPWGHGTLVRRKRQGVSGTKGFCPLIKSVLLLRPMYRVSSHTGSPCERTAQVSSPHTQSQLIHLVSVHNVPGQAHVCAPCPGPRDKNPPRGPCQAGPGSSPPPRPRWSGQQSWLAAQQGSVVPLSSGPSGSCASP